MINLNSIVRRMYDRTISWFIKTYGYHYINDKKYPFLATSSTFDLTKSENEGTLLVSGPCLDHAVEEGSSGVSFQIALETYFLIKKAQIMQVPVLLLIMSPCLVEVKTLDTWNQLKESYRRLVFSICRIVGYPVADLQLVQIWESDYVFNHMRKVYPLNDKILPFLKTLYQPSRALDYTDDRQLNDLLIRSYHDNLLAYHPEVIRRLSNRPFNSILHVENIQQIRAFYSAAKWFDISVLTNRQLVFVTTPSPNGGIRMTRADGHDRLPANLGAMAILEKIEKSELLSNYILTYTTKTELEALVNVFVNSFVEERIMKYD